MAHGVKVLVDAADALGVGSVAGLPLGEVGHVALGRVAVNLGVLDGMLDDASLAPH